MDVTNATLVGVVRVTCDSYMLLAWHLTRSQVEDGLTVLDFLLEEGACKYSAHPPYSAQCLGI